MAKARGVHVGINAHLLSSAASYRSAGVSNYSRHLLTALGQLVTEGSTEHRLTAFLHVDDFEPPGIQLRHGSTQLENPLYRIAWEQSIFPWALRGIQADVVHGLVNVLPLATSLSAQCAGVVTVHDLSFLRLPELFPPYKRAYLTALCRASVARAKQIVAVSRQTADDLAQAWGVDAARISVAPNGVDQRFTPGRPVEATSFRVRHALPARYWLYLGTLEPRKNLPMLLTAFAQWRQQASPADQAVHLVIAGGKGWYYETIFAQVATLGLTDVVHFPGFIPDHELPDWYRAAEFFVYPSRYEGFGLPVIEAMACGTPVLCSDAPGVREVAGESAILLPVEDVNAWVAAFSMVATQPPLRPMMRAAGLARAQQFTWENAARITLDAYARAGGTI